MIHIMWCHVVVHISEWLDVSTTSIVGLNCVRTPCMLGIRPASVTVIESCHLQSPTQCVGIGFVGLDLTATCSASSIVLFTFSMLVWRHYTSVAFPTSSWMMSKQERSMWSRSHQLQVPVLSLLHMYICIAGRSSAHQSTKTAVHPKTSHKTQHAFHCTRWTWLVYWTNWDRYSQQQNTCLNALSYPIYSHIHKFISKAGIISTHSVMDRYMLIDQGLSLHRVMHSNMNQHFDCTQRNLSSHYKWMRKCMYSTSPCF